MTERDGGLDDGGAPWPRAAERGDPPATTHGDGDPPPRPPVEIDDGIVGFSRLTRGRVGARLFTLFFVAVYAVIALNLVISLLSG